MRDREKLIALIRECNKFHEEAKEKWILGGKQGERPSLIASLADHLIANGVVVREKGEWIIPTKIGGRAFNIPHCSVCKGVPCGVDENTNFCPNCGADMRKGEGE